MLHLRDVRMPAILAIYRIRPAVVETLSVRPQTLELLSSLMHESDRTVREVLEAGGQGYVLKSDLANYLVKAVKAVFRGEIFLTPRVSKIVLEGFVKTGKEFGSGQISENGPTAREIEIIRLLGSGKANKEVAQELGITVRTVETHRAKIMRKLGLHSITQLLHYAIRKGILTAQDF
jgi:DNA-binding NarL/FixJ family response regulator